MTLRVYCAVAADPHRIAKEADLQWFDAIRERYPDDPLFKVGALSFTVDGTLPAQSAAMLEPYAGRDDAGEALVDPDELNRAVRLADAAGWQILTHATGDRAVRLALTAYAHAIRSNRPPARGRRHRLEHLAMVDAADIPRFGPLGVAASMQPSVRPGGPERLRAAVQIDRRAPCGAELPVRAAGRRNAAAPGQRVAGADPRPDGGPRADGQRVRTSAGAPDATGAAGPLKLKPAIDAYTSSGAWGSFDDQRKGSIAPGMLADLVVLSADVLEAPEKLETASVAVTIFDGKIVHRRDRRALTEPAPSLQH